MPLSDHEQRLLEQIEQALYAEDPKFATSVAARKMRSHPRRKLVLAVVGAVLGLALAAFGVILHPALVVIGFVVVVASCTLGVTVVRGPKNDADLHIVDGAKSSASARSAQQQANLRRRMEDRFRRRFEE
jgi:hypothetical protein